MYNFLSEFLGYLSKNKEWLFSGIGTSIVIGIWAFRKNIFSKAVTPIATTSNKGSVNRPYHSDWDTIKPSNSRFRINSFDDFAIPAGEQRFSFEYGLTGHAHPLNLKGKVARCEIHFSCQCFNPWLADHAGNEYALNFLQPQFLIRSRPIIEKYTLNNLRLKRKEIEQEIISSLKKYFESYGFDLLSVNIGTLDEIKS